MTPLFLPDAKLAPYWWDHVPRPVLPDMPLPPHADVVVVGSGYTGLHAALQTARGGRDTLVLDAEDAGWGCSTRNGGQISTSVKPGFGELARRHGADTRPRDRARGPALAGLDRRVRRERGPRLRFRRRRPLPCRAQRRAVRAAGAQRGATAQGPGSEAARGTARRAAQRAGHRRLLGRRGLQAARLRRPGALPPRPAASGAAGGGHAGCRAARRRASKPMARASRCTRRAAWCARATSSSPPTATPAR